MDWSKAGFHRLTARGVRSSALLRRGVRRSGQRSGVGEERGRARQSCPGKTSQGSLSRSRAAPVSTRCLWLGGGCLQPWTAALAALAPAERSRKLETNLSTRTPLSPALLLLRGVERPGPGGCPLPSPGGSSNRSEQLTHASQAQPADASTVLRAAAQAQQGSHPSWPALRGVQ